MELEARTPNEVHHNRISGMSLGVAQSIWPLGCVTNFGALGAFSYITSENNWQKESLIKKCKVAYRCFAYVQS